MGLYEAEVAQVHRLAGLTAEAVEAGRKVLVRCQAGLNRSSLVAALAMIRMGYQPQQAIDLIREKREPFCFFNQNFVGIVLAQEVAP